MKREAMRGMLLIAVVTMAGLASCNLPRAGTGVPGPIAQAATASLPATALPAKPLEVSHRPLYWFGPLPPMQTKVGRPFTGSDDFMDLFTLDAPWTEAASKIQVFKLYGEWVAYYATEAQLRQVVDDLRRRGMALAVEAGPLDPPAGCGQGIEGFPGSGEGLHIAERIKAAGGKIDMLALDEPYFFAHFYDGPAACHWPAEKVAQEVDKYIKLMRGEFPDVIVGDTEPLAGAAGAADYQSWLRTFRAVNGYDLAFLHMDMDWSRSTWPQEVKSIEDYGRTVGVPVGLIYTGNFQDTTDEAWISIAGERVKQYELQTGGKPDEVLFQSWNDKPDHVLPESQPYTFTNFIDAYFADKSALGIRSTGPGANVALHKSVRASAEAAVFPAAKAVDGDPGTWWSAGDGPPQWIEIDLGAPLDIRQVNLTTSQYPAGPTHHVVTGKGPGTNDAFVILCSLDGLTQDGEVLTCKEPEAWKGIQVIRVQTTTSSSWVAWREIEVIEAGG